MAGQGWTVKQAAEALGQSEKTIRRRIKSGEIRAEQVPGKYGVEYRITDLKSTPALDKGLDMIEDDALVKALDIVTALQKENERLAGQVGFLQAQLLEAESKIRLLTGPKPKQSWWQRLLRWGRD